MVEVNKKNQDRFLNGHLSRFIVSDEEYELANTLLVDGVKESEVFRQISAGKGRKKSHVSGKYKEGELKGS